MLSSTLRNTLVVAGVALVLPVLGASSAHADSGNGNGRNGSQGSVQQDAAPSSKEGEKGSAATPATSSNGKGSESDPSGSSANPEGTYQGKGSSTPDQDGKGKDRGGYGDDKTGPGTDGNNGCGNEPRAAAPRDGGRPTDDDNNGWCGAKPTPVKKAQPAKARPAAPVTASGTAAPVVEAPRTDAPVSGVVQGAATTRTAPVAAPVREALPAERAAARTAPVRAGKAVVGPPTGLAGAGAVVAQSAVAPQALPFTGAPVGLLLLLAALAVSGGAVLTVAARRSA